VFLGVLARKSIANAAIAPTKAPKMANATFGCVYENAIPAILIVRREPAAKKAPFVAKSDRRRLGTTIPAMNKVITTSISSRTREKAFCLFMVFPFSFRRAFSKRIILSVQLTRRRIPEIEHGRYPSGASGEPKRLGFKAVPEQVGCGSFRAASFA